MFYPYLGINFTTWIYASILLIGTIVLWMINYFWGEGVIAPEVLFVRNILYVSFIPFLILTHFTVFTRLLSFLFKHMITLLFIILAWFCLLFHTELLLVTSLASYNRDMVSMQHYSVHPYTFIILCAVAGALFYALGWILLRIYSYDNKWVNRVVKTGQVPALYVVYMLAVPAVLWLFPSIETSLSEQLVVTCFIAAVGLLVNFIWLERSKDAVRCKALAWFLLLLFIVYTLWILNPLHCEMVASCSICHKALLCHHWL